ncbi:MAG: hypothetical protein SCH71_13140 [Desulfobulbaceae bacterium]|nr:hypothetical protein [Desulfobulbaceae bacterium]
MMKNIILLQRISLQVPVFAAIFWLLSATAGSAAGDVCSDGAGIPPFLSPGGVPNMLIILDNSGSMLDMAYQDKINNSYCFDDTYLADEIVTGNITIDKEYTGNFKSDKWYVWTDVAPTGSVSAWTSGECYAHDQVVLDNSRLWKAFCSVQNCDSNDDGANDGCLATGSTVLEDNDNGGLVWADYFDWPVWKAGNYAAGDIVKFQNQLYYCTSPVTLNVDAPPTENTDQWEAIDHTWRANNAYATGDIVTYKGMIFEAKSSFTSSSTGLFDDMANPEDPASAYWNRIDEGYFAEYTGINPTPCTDPSYTYEPFDSVTGISRVDAVITMLDSNGSKITDVKTQSPAKVSCFAGRGNFLNWASASKFDIQKRILTGGKYSAGFETKKLDDDGNWVPDNSASPQTDTDDDRLIGENRGCTGKGFTKQVTLVPNEDPTKAIKLTMRVRGSTDDDWIDTTDDTTRIEILAVSEGGFDNAACQAVVDAIEAGQNFQSISGLINTCLAEGDNAERAALNHGLQYCEAYRSGKSRDLNTIIGDCESLYTDPTAPVSPVTIDPGNGAYACYGIFTADTLHSDREGYMGRCWGITSSGECVQKPCPNPDPTPNYYLNGGTWYTCAGDGFVYSCSGNFNENQQTCNKPWLPEFWTTALPHEECIPDSFIMGWSDDVDGIPTNLTAVPPELADGIISGDCHDGTFAEGVDCGCIGKAMEDYCKDLAVPEVIDPSDLASSTLEYLGLPGNLVDSGLTSQLGAKPLAVFKGYVKYTLPDGSDPDVDDQQTDREERPDGPRGVFYDIATSLRVGAMAFNANGSSYECGVLQETCTRNVNGVQFDACLSGGSYDGTLLSDITSDCYYCSIREPIIKFCPDDNRDSARVIADIKPIMEIDDNLILNDPSDDLEVWDHYSDLVAAVNDTRATSWTPLAEAMYNAFGYYGQRSDRCLTTDAGNCLDFTIDPSVDPVQNWCQDNHILIITEGASTADINDVVAAFATAHGDEDDEYADGVCSSGLDGSTYLDDMTYFGQNASASELFATPQINNEDKGYITTHIITTGSLTSGADECSPETLMENAAENGGTSLYAGEDPDSLQTNLESVLTDVLNRVSSGSAASVISSSRSGSGAVYQAIFWPELIDNDTGKKVEWAGEVHSLFIDSSGLLYEDTNQNGRLEPSADEGVDGLDRRLIFFYNEDARRTMACLKIEDYFANSLECPGVPTNKGQSCDGTNCLELIDIKFVWSAADWLAKANDANITSNRTPYLSADGKRYIYTWQDLNNDGIVDQNEFLPFTTSALFPEFPEGPLDVTPKTGFPARGSVADDFVTSADVTTFVGGAAPTKENAAKAVVDWIRGRDQFDDELTDVNGNGRVDKKLRFRQFPIEGVERTWRLGDVIHSTPTVVGRPAEAYHFIYKDPTYALFAKKWTNRRQMIYYGANDGMLHATNGGFYHEGTQAFCRELNTSFNFRTDPPADACIGSGPELGAEMWAYVPYNLIPHLKCLPDISYDHKYYVDQRPRIFDVQIFQDDCDYTEGFANCVNAVHPGGWGTILVGSMRFGGAPVEAAEVNGIPEDNRRFTSAFFILDITDPENPPELLGEMTMTTDTDNIPSFNGSPVITTTLQADMGYTTSSPTMVVMRENTGETNWYLIMGSGPNTIKGENTDPGQRGKIAILPLSWLKGEATDWSAASGSLMSPKGIDPLGKKAFRIPNRQPGTSGHQSGSEGGAYWVPDANSSFISDLITVDFDVETLGQAGLGGLYRSDAVYFGTIDGEEFYGPEGSTYWDGGGRLFRMVTKTLNINGEEIASEPNQWNDPESSGDQYNDGSDIANWLSPHNLLIDAKSPVTAAPTVGWDGKTFWVYFGTGRFYDKKDKPDSKQNRFFGIREMFDISGDLTCNDHRLSWETVDWWDNLNNMPRDLNALNHNGIQGLRGLLKVDDIIVAEWVNSVHDIPYLECAHCVDEDINVDGDGYDCQPLTADQCFPSDLSAVSVDDPNDTNNPPAKIDVYLYEDVRKYIAGTSCQTGLDGWYRDFHENRERNIGQAALLGGLLTYTGYQPHDDVCQAEGLSYLYGVHYQTGTAWYENVFGTFSHGGERFVKDKLSLGRGLATKASMHVGSGPNAATAFIQTSTGEIIEIGQENLPLSNTKTGRTGWSDDTE